MASTYPLAQGNRVSGGKAYVVRPVPNNPAGWPSGALFSTANALGEMSEYVGTYNNGGDPVEIFIREGKLFMRVGKNELQLSKIGDRRLIMK